jgi:hypothetical protein
MKRYLALEMPEPPLLFALLVVVLQYEALNQTKWQRS